MNAKKALKKTTLAFLLIAAMMCLLLPLFALPAEAAMNLNRGNCYQVDARRPIVVDGKMDEAYLQSVCVPINCSSTTPLRTNGVAYFAWSKSSIYCYVIVNDVDVAAAAKNADGTPSFWQADCVELYLHRGNDLLRDYPNTSNASLNGPFMPTVPNGYAHAGRQSARQYRIDGFSGEPSCYLFGPETATYFWDPSTNRWKNDTNGRSPASMMTDTLNAFGWHKGGWARNTFSTSNHGSPGYAVEYKIDFDKPLAAGESIRFDLMIADRFGPTSYRSQTNVFFPSGMRESAGAVVSNLAQNDYFVLSSSVSPNNGIIADENLYRYGRTDMRAEIENGVSYLGTRVVDCDPSVTSVSLRSDTAEIAPAAFADCPSLQSVVIPSSVTSIGENAFAGCSSLKDIYYIGTAQEWARIAKGGLGTGAALHFSPCYYGHNTVRYAAKAPTCIEIGWDAYVRCSRCDYTTYTQRDALGHNYIHYEAKAPSCTESGHEAYVTCTRCDDTTYREIPALLHAPAEEVVENRVEPSCVKMGGYDSVVYCSVCKKELSRKTNVLNLIGHDEVAHEAKAPTCTEIGWDAYVTCTRCDDTTYVEKAALGHDWDEGQVVIQQSCTSPWTVLYSCQRCEEEKLGTLNGGALAPHVYNKEVADDKYLKSPATESECAVYYKSCVCGEKGEETFTHGEPIKVEPPKDDDEPASGCGGSIGGTGIVILSLGVAAICKLCKRKED